jgi:hypothetical protein
MAQRPVDWPRVRASLDVTAYLALIVVMLCLPSAVPVLGAAFVATLYLTAKKAP